MVSRLRRYCLVIAVVISLRHLNTFAERNDVSKIYTRVIVGYVSDQEARVGYYNGTAGDLYSALENGKIIDVISQFSDRDTIIGGTSFDYATSMIFIGDNGYKTVDIFSPEGKWNRTLFTGTSRQVFGLCVDWLAKNVYWSDASYKWIKISTYNSVPSHHLSLVTTSLDRPAGIACDPERGYLYWSDIGEVKKIERSTLSGEERTVLWDENSVGTTVIGNPVSLSIDSNILYWADNNDGKIQSVNLNLPKDTPATFTTFSAEVSGIRSLDVANDFGLLVANEKTNHIYFLPFDRRSNDLSMDIASPVSLAYFSEGRQKTNQRQHPSCQNTSCTQLCTHEPTKYTCLCSVGYRLDADSKTCIEDDAIIFDYELVYSTSKGDFCRVPVDFGYGGPVDSTCLSYKALTSIDFDVAEGYIYTASDDSGEIRKRAIRGDDDWDILPQDVTTAISAIAVDWVRHHLYWTDYRQNNIKMADSNGNFVTTLVYEVNGLEDVVVHAVQMFLFWSNGGSNPGIERSDLTGRWRKVIVSTGISLPSYLATDINSDRIYWTDDDTKAIESVDFEGNQRQKFKVYSQDGLNGFGGLTIFQDFIFVSKLGENVIAVNEIYQKEDELPRKVENVDSLTMKVFHKGLQPYQSPGQGDCAENEGICDELCIDTENGVVCLCSDRHSHLNCTPVYRCPIIFPNGKVDAQCDNRNGQSCRYTCDDDFNPATDDEIECSTSGEWNIPHDELCTKSKLRFVKMGKSCMETRNIKFGNILHSPSQMLEKCITSILH
ncbi:low-density lipoprotein receptor-related protein 5-like [Ptychodera flava]|uniref:low-density lipoprotein receptor-related protein 5-like n=1 Tax=Ptychodera flava TaxID=63121 RepID=UPI00396A903B